MLEDSYYTILKPSEGFFRDKASKFYAYAFPVETEEEIKEILQNLKKEYYNATHHVYAYKLGVGEDDMRANDDGEPANSSGKPVLGQILSHQLSDVLVVVVRYY
ncbi:MAG: YigZ family protein, partial [Bacteroidales bacterium]|nr:YigZ family protein [Bacteroidales bacterium]